MRSEIAWKGALASTIIIMDISLALAGCGEHKHHTEHTQAQARLAPGTAPGSTAVAATVPESCAEPESAWTVLSSETQSGNTTLIKLNSADITASQPFAFTVRVCAQAAQQPDRLTADATMPAHKHGMNYLPSVRASKSQAGFVDYQVSGFVFHMPGVWEIKLAAYHDAAVTQYTHTLTLK